MADEQTAKGTMKHPNDMTRDELRDLVEDMGEMALDIAQHLCVTVDMKPEYQNDAVKRACRMAYDLASYPLDGQRMKRGNCTIVSIGDGGASVVRRDIAEEPNRGR